MRNAQRPPCRVALPRNCLMHYHEVELRQHGDMLPDGAKPGVRTFERASPMWPIPHPPQITIAERAGAALDGVHLVATIPRPSRPAPSPRLRLGKRVVFAALAARKLKVPASPLVERCISKLLSFVELSIHPTVI